MKSEGVGYFKQFWNILDCLCFVAFAMLFAREFIIKEKKNESKNFDLMLNVFIALQMLLKTNYYLRVYQQFGLLVNLISTCVVDMIPFCVYLFVYELFFVLVYIRSGIKAPARKGFEDGDFFGMLLYVWENSIGNINDPDDSSFALLESHSFNGYLIWIIWVFNQVIVVIILLNFLIAVISQSYENVMSNKVIKQYQDIAALNKETYEFLEFLFPTKYCH